VNLSTREEVVWDKSLVQQSQATEAEEPYLRACLNYGKDRQSSKQLLKSS